MLAAPVSADVLRALRHRERWSDAEVLEVIRTAAAAQGCRVRVQGKRRGQGVDPMVVVVAVVVVSHKLSCRDVTCNLRYGSRQIMCASGQAPCEMLVPGDQRDA